MRSSHVLFRHCYVLILNRIMIFKGFTVWHVKNGHTVHIFLSVRNLYCCNFLEPLVLRIEPWNLTWHSGSALNTQASRLLLNQASVGLSLIIGKYFKIETFCGKSSAIVKKPFIKGIVSRYWGGPQTNRFYWLFESMELYWSFDKWQYSTV